MPAFCRCKINCAISNTELSSTSNRLIDVFRWFFVIRPARDPVPLYRGGVTALPLQRWNGVWLNSPPPGENFILETAKRFCTRVAIIRNKKHRRSGVLILARPAGLEPATYCLEGNCSIQLSHGRMLPILYQKQTNCKFF